MQNYTVTCYTRRHEACDVPVDEGPDGDLADVPSALRCHGDERPDVHPDRRDAAEAAARVRSDHDRPVLGAKETVLRAMM